MNDILGNMIKRHDYLICIDSDGCVFDNMGLKHKECFCPATVNCWDLQSVAGYAREAAEFVNLYSSTRGMNRYPALIRTLELLEKREEVRRRGYKVPDLTPLRKWVDEANILSLSCLTEYVRTHNEPVLHTTVRWSNEVDENINKIVRNVPPLPFVKESLAKMREFADIVIVSATPHNSIVREWTDNGLIEYVTEVAGQELGSKKACIAAANMGERYSADKVLMIGDAPGDMEAAKSNGVRFYPIIPGREEFSWERMLTTVAGLLRNGEYSKELESTYIGEFLSVLPVDPPWTR